jgi:hypothetical protein
MDVNVSKLFGFTANSMPTRSNGAKMTKHFHSIDCREPQRWCFSHKRIDSTNNRCEGGASSVVSSRGKSYPGIHICLNFRVWRRFGIVKLPPVAGADTNWCCNFHDTPASRKSFIEQKQNSIRIPRDFSSNYWCRWTCRPERCIPFGNWKSNKATWIIASRPRNCVAESPVKRKLCGVPQFHKWKVFLFCSHLVSKIPWMRILQKWIWEIEFF